MKFQSTRDTQQHKVTGAQAIKQGLAGDGGLFVPEEIPTLTKADIRALAAADYPARAAKILGMFLTDYTEEELLADCRAAYAENAFPGGAAPLADLGKELYALELWHGPTAAFKDMALQIMPHLLSRALVKTGETREALILVATSGDTGKAALEGYKDIAGIRIMVFYPENGVSRVQKLQMQTQTGENVNVTAIRGNFDDAQTGVKRIFGDSAFAETLAKSGFFLSSANSINWGRLAPQIVYYISAYCDLMNEGRLRFGDPLNVTVPTGNFGNIFAAFLAKQMGLPLGQLICASNRNNILTDFLRTGTYDRNREFYCTMSPSMDILISSNLERLLYFTAGSARTAAYMKRLNETGAYTVEADVKTEIDRHFKGYFADEEKTAATIRNIFNRCGYLPDTHTAVGLSAAADYRRDTGDLAPMIVASTASPYKFAADVYKSLTGKEASSALGALDELAALTNTELPYPLKGIEHRPVRFTDAVDAAKMPEAVLNFCLGSRNR